MNIDVSNPEMKPFKTNEQKTEQEIQDKGLNAPRLSPDDIDSVITGKHFFTAADGDRFARFGEQFAMEEVPQSLECLTFCVLVLKNGFTVTGESACASPENFDKLIGQEIAYNNAREKIWVLEGYLLKEKLHTVKHCSDERPCVNCFSDTGKCLDNPN